MKLRYIIASLAAAAALFSGCKEEGDTYYDEIRVSQSYVGIPMEGGEKILTLDGSANVFGEAGPFVTLSADETPVPQAMINAGEWMDVDMIVDLDALKVSASVGGSDYKTFAIESASHVPYSYFGITLAGGNITGGVYARGIVDGDAVTGDATVTVTGSANYACGIYGFSRMSGEEDKAELTFDGYTGIFSGDIHGFKKIALAGDTAMIFAPEAEISNTAWAFDTTERTAGAVFATGTMADFSGATVTLKLDEAAAPVAWNLFAGGESTTYNKFDVFVDGVSILPETIELGEQIAAGDYAGWGFTVEENVLKFKNLA